MSIHTKIKEITKEIEENRELYKNANVEQTKQALVLPFIEALGYNTRSIIDVQWGSSLFGNGIDCTLISGNSMILIVCKRLGDDITEDSIKRLTEYYNGCTSDNKIGMITDGERYTIFADSIVAGYMDSKPFDSFNISNLDKSDIDKIEKLTKENINKHRIVLDRNYEAFEGICSEAITNIIYGKAQDAVIDAILEQSELKHYKEILDKDRLRKIMGEQSIEIIANGAASKTSKIFKKLEKDGFSMDGEDDYEFDINDDINTGFGKELNTELLKKYIGKNVRLYEIPYGLMNSTKFNRLVVEGKVINVRSSKDALAKLIAYTIEKDAENKGKLMSIFQYKTFRMENGQGMADYKRVKPIYLKEHDLSIIVCLSTSRIVEFMYKILEIAGINSDDVEVGIASL